MIVMTEDPTERSLWRPVFRLLHDMDGEIARVYADNGIADLKTNWVPVILKLHARGPMTIADLARGLDQTHSAMSQKVADKPPAEWNATEASLEELEAQLPYSLTRVAADIRLALASKSFHDRITEK